MPEISISATDFQRLTEGLFRRIKEHVRLNNTRIAADQAADGLAGFCYRYPRKLQRLAFRTCGLPVCTVRAVPNAALGEAVRYARFLARLPEECVFLLQDSHEVYTHYRRLTGHGLAIEVNRRTTCRTETDYLVLVDLFYRALASCGKGESLSDAYFREFRRLVRGNRHFREVGAGIAGLLRRYSETRSLRFVDIGYQATFTLFCQGCLRLWTRTGANHRIHSFSVYPWLRDDFGELAFSRSSQLVPSIEAGGRLSSHMDALSRSQGAIVGFAVGDAMGAPAAGVDFRDLKRQMRLPLVEYTTNPAHPFFARLPRGSVSANTMLMRFSGTQAAIRPFESVRYARNLAAWGKTALSPDHYCRWIGPTTRHAIEKLLGGSSPMRSGSRTTTSCGAIYRVIPYAIVCRTLPPRDLAKLAAEVGSITHRSPVSRAGCAFVAVALAQVLNHNPIDVSFEIALGCCKTQFPNITALWGRCAIAISHGRQMSPAKARLKFGTSAEMRSTLPLAISLVLHANGSFREAVLAGANSFRMESPAGHLRLAGYTPREQLIRCHGGNTDGIAAIGGAFAGAVTGGIGIDRTLTNALELHRDLERMAYRLWLRSCRDSA